MRPRRDEASLSAPGAPANGEQLGILARLKRGPIMTRVAPVKFGTRGLSGTFAGPDGTGDLTPDRASAKRTEIWFFCLAGRPRMEQPIDSISRSLKYPTLHSVRL